MRFWFLMVFVVCALGLSGCRKGCRCGKSRINKEKICHKCPCECDKCEKRCKR